MEWRRTSLKAIILCAGYGKRLKPYTDKFQKSMIPVHGKPVLEYILEALISVGFKRLIFVVGYRKEQIITHFGGGINWNIEIEYVEQKKLNGTGGAVLLCENNINNDHFFLTWGDVLVEYSVYEKIINEFKTHNDEFILVANHTNDPYLGAAIISEGDYLVDIVEKPPKGMSATRFNNSGIFILSRQVFGVLKNLEPSIRGEIELPDAIRWGIAHDNWKVRVLKMGMNQFRADFGNKEIYELLNKESDWLKTLKT